MSAVRRLGAVALLGTLAGAGAAAAQRPHRSGLWGELSPGFGSLRVACAGCPDVIRTAAGGGVVRIGGVVSDRVLLGVESSGFLDETFGFAPDDTSLVAEFSMVAVTVLWFPWRSGGFLKGGVGIAQGEFTAPGTAAQSDTVAGTGIGLTFGVGWDVPLSRKFALTANAGASITAIGDVILPAGRIDDVIGTLYHLTFSFTFR
jgi:hypothetical protein